MLTLPAGPPQIVRGMRLYNTSGVRNLVPGIESLSFFAKESRGGCWQPVEGDEISEIAYDEAAEVAPALGVAFVLARK